MRVTPHRLLIALALYLTASATLHVTWMLTGIERWLIAFRALNGAWLIGCAAMASALAVDARRSFADGDPFRRIWTFLLAASLARLLGHLVTHAIAWPAPHAPGGLAQVGRAISGPPFFALLAIGLAGAIAIYHARGPLARARLTPVDLLLGALVFAFALQSLRDLITWRDTIAIRDGAADVLLWTSDPLLAALLAEAILIRRAAVRMGAGHFSALLGATMIRRDEGRLGAGYVSRCWSAYAGGILLTAIGDMGLWAIGRRWLVWPWLSIIWYVWPIAELAFVLAPAWQLVASRAVLAYELLPEGIPIVLRRNGRR